MMEIVTDSHSRPADPDREYKYAKVRKGSADLDWTCKPPETGVVDTWEDTETYIEVDDEKHATVETETELVGDWKGNYFSRSILLILSMSCKGFAFILDALALSFLESILMKWNVKPCNWNLWYHNL